MFFSEAEASIFPTLMGLTARLRQAGSMMYECKQKREPGLACNRIVERSRCAAVEQVD